MVALSRHLWNNERLNFQEENNMVTLHTNFGDIKIKLDFDKAPITAENFLNYCKNGFYNNTIFHRVIDGFMIQGGGMESGMREKATNAPIQNEANNRLSNKTWHQSPWRVPLIHILQRHNSLLTWQIMTS